MAVMLPDDLVWVLNLLGFNWPNVDEDKLAEAASSNRKLAEQVAQAAEKAKAGTAVVTSANQGAGVDAFAKRQETKSGPHLDRLAQVYGLSADGLDALAVAVVAAKGAVIAQLIALAAEIASAAAASVVTFGISDAAGLAATALTKVTVRKILDELKHQITQTIKQLLLGEALQALAASAADLASQEIGTYVGTQQGVSLTQAAKAGAGSAIGGAEGLATGAGAAQTGAGVGLGTVQGLLKGGKEE